MASTVLSGTDKTILTYTNNTGQNVRVIINYLRLGSKSDNSPIISAGNLTITGDKGEGYIIGRNLAFSQSYLQGGSGTSIAVGLAANNGVFGGSLSYSSTSVTGALPTELMLSAGEVFSIRYAKTISIGEYGNAFSYNIVIIPENG